MSPSLNGGMPSAMSGAMPGAMSGQSGECIRDDIVCPSSCLMEDQWGCKSCPCGPGLYLVFHLVSLYTISQLLLLWETDLDKSYRFLSGSLFVSSLYVLVLFCIVLNCRVY